MDITLQWASKNDSSDVIRHQRAYQHEEAQSPPQTSAADDKTVKTNTLKTNLFTPNQFLRNATADDAREKSRGGGLGCRRPWLVDIPLTFRRNPIYKIHNDPDDQQPSIFGEESKRLSSSSKQE